jgi:hypothetical protein
VAFDSSLAKKSGWKGNLRNRYATDLWPSKKGVLALLRAGPIKLGKNHDQFFGAQKVAQMQNVVI